MGNKIQKKKNNLALQNYETLKGELSKVLENQKISKKKQDQILETTQKGFIGLALRSEELLKLNEQLTQQLETVVDELNQIKQERQEKAARKEARANRKRLPKRDPMTSEIYKELIKEAEGPTYLHVRLRLALCLLVVTGVRINELLNIKVSQLKTLTQGYIIIDRSKRGPSNHKAFLHPEGKKMIRDRKKDFDFMFLIKEPDAYVFTSEANHYQKLRREAITKDVNKVLRSVSTKLPGQPNITSHSFRIGYITKLWRDTKDIEFVKQDIGHRTINNTSSYVTILSDEERQKRISTIPFEGPSEPF